MEHKIYKSIVEETNTKGEVIIAINAIGNIDKQNDRSMSGSFNKTISEGLKNIFWYKNHDSNEVLGVPKRLWEDNIYLNAQAKFNLDKEFSRNMYSDYKFFQENGQTIKHSVGVTAIKFDMNKDIRDVKEWKLWEFSSLTKWPANDETPTHSIKSFDEIELNEILKNIETYLTWISQKGIHTDEHILQVEKFDQQIKTIISGLPLKAQAETEPLKALNLDYLINNFKL
jgi:phage head maturation protease